jgi:tight adherence protein B
MPMMATIVVVLLFLLFGLVAVATSPREVDTIVRQRLAAIPPAAAQPGSGRLDAPGFLARDSRAKGRLDAALRRFGFIRRLQKYIAQSAISQTAAGLLAWSLALGGAGFVLALFFAPILPLELAAAAAIGSLPCLRVAWLRARRIAAFAAALPDAIDTLARSLRVGHSMAAAIEIVAENCVEPAASEFGEVYQQQNFGLPLREALLQMLDRMPSHDLRIVVTAILVQRDTGGNLIEMLDRTAFMIRDRQRIRGEIRIHTAQGRLTGWVLSLLPVAMLLMVNLVDPGYSRILFVDPLGRKLIYAGVGLIAVGAVFIHRIVNGIEV